MELKTILLSLLLATMVLVGVMQTVQVFTLSNALNSEKGLVTTTSVSGSSYPTANAAANTSSTTTSLDSLPSMVGGC